MTEFERDEEILVSGARFNYDLCIKTLEAGDITRTMEHFQDLILEVGQQIGSMQVRHSIDDEDILDGLYYSVEPWIRDVNKRILRLLTTPPHFNSNPFCTEEYELD